MTVSGALEFFKRLDLQKKVEVLNELSSALRQGVGKRELVGHDLSFNENEEDRIIDELFGIWKGENQLISATMVNKTISDRKLDLN